MRVRTRMITAVLAAVVAVGVVPGGVASASAPAPRFANCTAMHKAAHGKYKGGIARKGAKDKRARGHAKYRPVVNNAYYAANRRLDRDRDGIACEQ